MTLRLLRSFPIAALALAAVLPVPARAQCVQDVLFFEDFDSGAAGWTLSGNWILNSAPPQTCFGLWQPCFAGRVATIKNQGWSHLCTCAAFQNTPMYEPCSGDLRSPAIALPTVGADEALRLDFCLGAMVDGGCGNPAADCSRIEIRSPTKTRIYSFNDDNTIFSACPLSITKPPYDLSEFAGEVVVLSWIPACVDAEGRTDITIDDVMISRLSGVPIPYCSAAPNSAGAGAHIASGGTTSVAANDFTLEVRGAPPGQLGLFLFAKTAAQVPFGDGWRCVGPPVERLVPAALIASDGSASRLVDFQAPPALGKLVPGTTWHFQHWYRDPLPVGAGFNLSNGLRATFCP